MVTIGVLALQGAFAEHQAALQRCQGVIVQQIRLPQQLKLIDGLIIPGGESPVIAKLLQDMKLLSALRYSVAQNMPIWGTCAGAILLAKMIDGLDNPILPCIDMAIQRNAFGRQASSFIASIQLNTALFESNPLIQDATKPQIMGHIARNTPKPPCNSTSQISSNTDYIPSSSTERTSWEMRIQGAKRASSGIYTQVTEPRSEICNTEVAPPKTFEGVFIRAPHILANNPNVVVALQQNNYIATTFHPELTEDLLFHNYFVQLVRHHKEHSQ